MHRLFHIILRKYSSSRLLEWLVSFMAVFSLGNGQKSHGDISKDTNQWHKSVFILISKIYQNFRFCEVGRYWGLTRGILDHKWRKTYKMNSINIFFILRFWKQNFFGFGSPLTFILLLYNISSPAMIELKKCGSFSAAEIIWSTRAIFWYFTTQT